MTVLNNISLREQKKKHRIHELIKSNEQHRKEINYEIFQSEFVSYLFQIYRIYNE